MNRAALALDPSRTFVAGVAVLTVGIMLAMAACLRALHSRFAVLGEQAIVMRLTIVALGVACVAPLIVILHRRAAVHLDRVALFLLSSISVVLGAVYFYSISFAVLFPADFLLWSEGDFVADITKLTIGYPLYTAPPNLESFTYTPGAQVFTYSLMRLLGLDLSVPAMRMIQVGFMIAAGVVATLSLRVLLLRSGLRDRLRPAWLWYILATAVLVLVAGNATTNPFTYYLHNDALALLTSSVAFWLLLEYMASGRREWLVGMAVVPGLGFLVKQSLVVWAGLSVGYLAVFDRPRRWLRLAAFGVSSVVGIGLAIWVCYTLWGSYFFYWAFEVMGHHAVSPMRSLLHALDAWAYFALGLVSYLVLGRDMAPWALGAWVVAMALLTLEAYTSGIAWMLNHMGPGSLLVAVFGLVMLVRLWPQTGAIRRSTWLPATTQAGFAVFLVGLFAHGLGLVTLPIPAIPADATRYARDIEAEFDGLPTDRVLLDFGSWLYAPAGVIMKDRAATSGEAGWTQTADFSGFLARIQQGYYAKILVREYHDSTFTYDHSDWPTSSGVRRALGTYYREVRQIPAVSGQRSGRVWFRTISVLVPAGSSE